MGYYISDKIVSDIIYRDGSSIIFYSFNETEPDDSSSKVVFSWNSWFLVLLNIEFNNRVYYF